MIMDNFRIVGKLIQLVAQRLSICYKSTVLSEIRQQGSLFMNVPHRDFACWPGLYQAAYSMYLTVVVSTPWEMKPKYFGVPACS